MKKTIACTLLALFAGLMLVAQESDNKIHYKNVINDPYAIPNLEIKISPAWISMSGTNLGTGGWFLGADLDLGKRIHLDAAYGSTYTKKLLNSNYPGSILSSEGPLNYNMAHSKESDIIVTQDLKPVMWLNAGISFAISDKVKTIKRPITLHSSQYRMGNYNVINADVTYVDTELRRKINLRLGYYGSANNFSTDIFFDDGSEYFEDQQGNKFYTEGIQYADVNYSHLQDAPNGEEVMSNPMGPDGSYMDYPEGWITSISTQGFAFGISRQVIRNHIINVEEYGMRGIQAIGTLYADLLYAKVKVDEIMFFESDPQANVYGEEIGTEITSYDISGEGENKIQTNNLGFRVGLENRGISPTKIIPWAEQSEVSKFFNFGYKGELGVEPGLKGKGFYFTLGIYLAINARV